MGRKIISNDIRVLLDMIREQSEIIAGYDAKIPQIEIDIIMANIRRLYDDFNELNRLNKAPAGEVLTSRKTPAEPEQERELVKIIAPVISEKEPNLIQEEPLRETEEAPQVVDKPEENSETTTPVKHTEPSIHKKQPQGKTFDLFGEPENVTLADTFRDQKQTAHEKLVDSSKDKTLADMIKQPIRDLKSGIGVNDRFLFINEMFKGVMGDYDMAIASLDNCDTLEQALEKLTELSGIMGWKQDSETLRKFENFIRRKFI